ncbi:MAG: fructose-6-phosphate aldolase [Alphaproteobacteria bacterium]|nr:fructose-6-phosphate aldolase [Alphaproteobacteria bacterium]
MKFFVDSADIEQIKELNDIGLVDGVTTNPSIIAKSGKDFFAVIKEITDIVSGPVSAEVTATEHEEMLAEGLALSKIAPNVVVKVPLTMDGLKTCKVLSEKGIMVNVTLCFSTSQALLAAKSGATFISPFVGRLEDVGQDGMSLIQDILDVYDNYGFKTEVLVASVRNTNHVYQSALLGAHVMTAPPKIIRQLADHPLTDKGLEAFLSDWKKTGQKILAD